MCKRLDDFAPDRIGPKSFIFIEEDWSKYCGIIDLCVKKKGIITIIAPFWEDDHWFQTLLLHTTHTFTLPKSAFVSAKSNFPKVAAFVADFRWTRGRGRSIINEHVPLHDKVVKRILSFPERIVLPLYNERFKPSLPVQPLDVEKFVTLARTLKLDLPQELIEDVIHFLQNNWSTHYRGFADWFLNFSKPHDKETEKQMRQQIEEEIKLGRVSGPFSRPPFPVPWCNKQAKVCRIFGVPKNKLDKDDPTLRIIFDKSFPAGTSKNDLTPRTDAMLPYWNATLFLKKIAELGKNTLMFFADIKSAYKLLTVKPEEWNLQVFQIGDEFFVDKTFIFGDVAAADGFDRFMRVDLAIARAILHLEYLQYYVDNSSNLTPPLPCGSPDRKRADSEWLAFRRHYAGINMPLHHFIPPTTRVESHLGWGIDTELMIVFIKEERRLHIEETLKELKDSKEWSKQKLDSLIGVLTFCAPIIRCLRAPLRQFIAMQVFMNRPGRRYKRTFAVNNHIIFVCDWILSYLSQWNGEASIVRLFNPRPRRTIYVDAGTLPIFGEVWGIGAWCQETGEYISVPWLPHVYEESKTPAGRISAPFLETFAVLTAILTLGGSDSDIDLAIIVDCEPAAKIFNKRWCKTNNILNNYIAYTDLASTNRYICSHVHAVLRENNWGAHYLSHGEVETARRHAPLKKRLEPTYPELLWPHSDPSSQ